MFTGLNFPYLYAKLYVVGCVFGQTVMISCFILGSFQYKDEKQNNTES